MDAWGGERRGFEDGGERGARIVIGMSRLGKDVLIEGL